MHYTSVYIPAISLFINHFGSWKRAEICMSWKTSLCKKNLLVSWAWVFWLQEATLAVAEVERKKRERKKKRSIASHAKNRHSFRRKSALGIELQQGRWPTILLHTCTHACIQIQLWWNGIFIVNFHVLSYEQVQLTEPVSFKVLCIVAGKSLGFGILLLIACLLLNA